MNIFIDWTVYLSKWKLANKVSMCIVFIWQNGFGSKLYWHCAPTSGFDVFVLERRHMNVTASQTIDCLFYSLFRPTIKKTSKLPITDSLWGEWPLDSPHKRSVKPNAFPCKDVFRRGCKVGNPVGLFYFNRLHRSCRPWWRVVLGIVHH